MENSEQLSIDLKKGEQLTVATFRFREGSETLLQEYFTALTPIATSYGFAKRGSLNVIESIGAYQPVFMGLSTFPGKEEAKNFEKDPRWPPIKAKRPAIWTDLRISKFDIQNPLILNFKKNKIYEMRYEWFKDENFPPLMEIKMGKVAVNFANGTHEFLPSDLKIPSRISIIEWSDLTVAKANRPQGINLSRIDSVFLEV